MSKTAILPIISVLALVVGGIFHISIDDNEQSIIAESIALAFTAGTAIWGIIKNHFPSKG